MTNTKRWTVAAAFVFLVGAVLSGILLLRPQGDCVNIISDGKVVYTIDLRTSENRTFTVEYEGSYNEIQIENGDVRVIGAGCPDKTCVKMGVLSGANSPIICLPNRLVIEYTDKNDDMDAVSR